MVRDNQTACNSLSEPLSNGGREEEEGSWFQTQREAYLGPGGLSGEGEDEAEEPAEDAEDDEREPPRAGDGAAVVAPLPDGEVVVRDGHRRLAPPCGARRRRDYYGRHLEEEAEENRLQERKWGEGAGLA